MTILRQNFNERLAEIEEYIQFLVALEESVGQGKHRIGNCAVTARHQRILYSSVYIQIYNLVEATITWCLEAVCGAAASDGACPAHLSDSLLQEWVRYKARTHQELNADRRLERVLGVCEMFMSSAPLESWKMERGGGGNWDDREIEEIAKRIGLQLRITPDAYQGVKRKVRDEKGVLGLVRDLRNQLAHGEISFNECGGDVTASELAALKDAAAKYLTEVVAHFDVFLSSRAYLRENWRLERQAAP